MTQDFDKGYWESHWQQAGADGAGGEIAPNPHLAREIGGLEPGTALDAGCGEGAEAIWLAAMGWRVTAADVSAEALAHAAERAATADLEPARVRFVEADLTVWEPGRTFDLVTTHYAHPAMPQLAFYERIAEWVAPGGTLLIVGHLHSHDVAGHGHDHTHPPEEVSVTAHSITALLDTDVWDVVTADELARNAADRSGRAVELRDAVVHATRRALTS